MKTYTPWKWRNKPQENRYWFVAGSYGGRKGILEWCDSMADAIRTANAMMSCCTSLYDLKIMRLS